MGAFAYSHEVGTYSGTHYEDDVPQEVKERRVEEIMAIQQQISGEVQEAKVGKTFKVIIDRREGDYYVGRTEFDSPEVDPEVLIPVNEGRLYKGHFYKIQIKSADDFDLYGSRIK